MYADYADAMHLIHLVRQLLRQVPGGANDSLTSNTKLGRAVEDACNELEALGKLVMTRSVCMPLASWPLLSYGSLL